MTASKVRLWIGGTAVLCVLLLVAAWFLLVSPQRAEAAELEQAKVDNDASNAALRVKIDELEAQYAELPARRAELAEVRLAMPEDPQVARFLRDLDYLAAETGVELVSVAPTDPVTVASATPVAPAPAPEEGEDAGSTAGEAPAAPPAPASVLAQISTTAVVDGDFFAVQLFVQKLQEQMSRDFLVTSLVLGESSDAEAEDGDVSMTITGMAFVLRTQGSPTTTTPTTTATAAAPVAPANG